MLINEVIQSLTESYYEDLMVAIQDILTNLPEEQDSIPTEELRYRLSELGFDESIERLIKAVEEKDNPYYCQLALNEQDTKGNGVLVDLPKNIMNDIRKKKHFGYQQKVSKTKRDYDRKIKSKDLLRGDSQD